MDYPHPNELKVKKIWGEEDVVITFYSGMTIFIGPNGSGKTQTLKALREELRTTVGKNKVRYLSSNRIGTMEQYRSKVNRFGYSPDDFNFGGASEKAQRLAIETATGDFFTMDAKKEVYIKVAERLSVLFGRQIYLKWDSGNLKVYFEKTKTQKEYSVVAEASGLVNVISILAALFDNDIQFLLIDEPEVSLHPQLQSYLLREMQTAIKKWGKTIVISTHSPEMISFEKIKDISNLVFFSENKLPIQVVPDEPILDSKKLQDFIIRIGHTYKEGFFAKKILLIEGASDFIICKFLLRKLNLNIDVAGSQIIPVDGKGQFAVIAKLFRLIGKDVSVLTDLDGFTDDNSIIDIFSFLPVATEEANKLGAESLADLSKSIKTKIAQLLAKDQEDVLKDIYKSHPYWNTKNTTCDDTEKIIRRAVVAKLFATTADTIQQWPNYKEWNALKNRMITLFSAFESIGCFILRLGAIESYYQFSPSAIYDEKPSTAADEISNLQDKNNELIEEKYADVIRPLKYIALTSEVDERYAVKKELLSELALILEVLPHTSDEKLLYNTIKQTKGSAISLFNYRLIIENNVKGVEVSIKSNILDIVGFPFKIFVGQNVNEIVNKYIQPGDV